MIRQDRTDWQGALARCRNDHWEHRKTIDPKLVAVFHRPDSAATIFENVWQAIEDIVVLFLLRPLAPPGIALVEVPEGSRCSRTGRSSLSVGRRTAGGTMTSRWRG
jgi:hypothetical protein